MKLFNVLRGYIVRAGLTQNELAKCIGMPHTALSKRLSGEIEFRRSEMLAIQSVLNEQLKMELTIQEIFF